MVINILRNQWYNANSIYNAGLKSKQLVEYAKLAISKEINCKPEELIFCSCGSEANALATSGYIMANTETDFITSNIEHPSILENPHAKPIIKVDKDGFFDMNIINNIYNSLVSLQFANSEIGTIQNLKEIVKILHKNNCVVHSDAVAVLGKLKIDVQDLGLDMMTATAQKIGGILGAAFLYKKTGIKIDPLIYGHDTLRGGTPNVAAIASLGKVIADYDYSSVSPDNRDYVYDYIINTIPDSYLIGSKKNRLPHNLYVCFRGIEGESLTILLDMNGIQVSTGSACNSGNLTASAVLSAIGMDEQDIHSCIRMTFSGTETKEELDYICNTLNKCVLELRNLKKTG